MCFLVLICSERMQVPVVPNLQGASTIGPKDHSRPQPVEWNWAGSMLRCNQARSQGIVVGLGAWSASHHQHGENIVSTRSTSLIISRRRILCGAGGAACAAMATTLVVGSAEAATKQSQKASRYQLTPHGPAQCSNCKDWAAPDGCNSVSGTVVPTGWCLLYALKP